MSKRTRILLAALAVAWLGIPAHADTQRLYKWVDADGVVHFSSERPEGIEVETLDLRSDRVPTPAPAPPPSDSAGEGPNTYGAGIDPPEPPGPEEEEGLTPQELQRQKEQLCARGRYLLEVLLPRPRAVLVDPDGQPRTVTDQERQQYLEEGRRLTQRYCPKQ